MAWQQAEGDPQFHSDNDVDSGEFSDARAPQRKRWLTSRGGLLCLGFGWICWAATFIALLWVLFAPLDIGPPPDVASSGVKAGIVSPEPPRVHCVPVSTTAPPALQVSTSMHNPLTTMWSQEALPRRLLGQGNAAPTSQLASSLNRPAQTMELMQGMMTTSAPLFGAASLPQQPLVAGSLESPPAIASAQSQISNGALRQSDLRATTTLTTCFPVRSPSHVSASGGASRSAATPSFIPVSTVGQCTNAHDLAIYQGAGMIGFHVAMHQCAEKCWARAGCVAECFGQKLGYSKGCGQCFANVPSCTMTNCLMQCVTDSPTCGECSSKKCLPSFAACAGVDPRNATDFGMNLDGTNPDHALMEHLGLKDEVGLGLGRALVVSTAAPLVAVAAAGAAMLVCVLASVLAARRRASVRQEQDLIGSG
eukprot:TRINITY_DN26887_c0_g1_i1.p1 TRINITY_DN26887_c0_g1~~TRINITY_DN26887_c0_g1_i1.p1  ORF type:complete len:440 (+),score=60.61 TRINITY_DN26887_c0_g1_i1:57-1322(+)